MEKDMMEKLKLTIQKQELKRHEKIKKGTEKVYNKIMDLILKNSNQIEIDIKLPIKFDCNHVSYLTSIYVGNKNYPIGKTYVNLYHLYFMLSDYKLELKALDKKSPGELKVFFAIKVNTANLKSTINEKQKQLLKSINK